jgi:hypothetical protein
VNQNITYEKHHRDASKIGWLIRLSSVGHNCQLPVKAVKGL